MLDGVNPQSTRSTARDPHEIDQRSALVTPNSKHEGVVTSSLRMRAVPGQDEIGPDGRQRDTFELSQEAEEIRRLQTRDREVRNHEAAHAAAGGAFAGSPSYQLQRGPDGQTYAVGGEVSIDISPVAGDPQATIMKARQIRTAALAPTQPSAQDMRVAQKAQLLETAANRELQNEKSKDMKAVVEGEAASQEEGGSLFFRPDSTREASDFDPSGRGNFSGFARLSIYA